MPQSLLCRIFLARCLSLLGLLCLFVPSNTWSQPLKPDHEKAWVEITKQSIAVQIQSATRVELQVQRNREGKPEITGRLFDDQGKGIPRAPLLLQLPNKKQVKLQTNREGHFRKEVKDFPPKGIFSLRFPGQGSFRQSQIRRSLDLGRVDASFSASFPKPLPSGTKRFVIQASLHYKGTPLSDYPLQLFLGRLEKQTEKSSIPLVAREETPPRTCKDLGVPLMTLSTDGKGKVRFVWKGRALEGAAQIPLCLMFQGDRYFLPQDRRHTLQILPGKPKSPSSPSWPWLVGLVFFAFVGGAWFLRKKPQPPPPVAKKLSADELLRQHDVEEVSLQRSVRPPQDRVFSGRLIDLFEKMPVVQARICLLQGEKETEVALSQRDGTFHWEAPKDLEGPLDLWIKHPAFREKSLKVPCPHYGEGRRLQVGLYSYRYLCLEAFRQGVESLHRSINPRKKTAREILDLLPEDLATLMRPLAMGFEHAYYAPKHPSKELYQQVSIALKALLAQDHALLPEITLATDEFKQPPASVPRLNLVLPTKQEDRFSKEVREKTVDEPSRPSGAPPFGMPLMQLESKVSIDSTNTYQEKNAVLSEYAKAFEVAKKTESSHTMELMAEEVEAAHAATKAFEDLQRRDPSRHTLQLSAEQRAAFFSAALDSSEAHAQSISPSTPSSKTNHPDGES